MKTANFLNSNCRHCRYFDPEGRRGGNCQKLGVPVDSNWQACALACPPFSPTWKTLEEIVHLETSFAVKYTSIPKAAPAPHIELSPVQANSV